MERRTGLQDRGLLLSLLLILCFQGQGGLFPGVAAPPPAVYPPPVTPTAPTYSCVSPTLGTIALLMALGDL
jgi:hypothetical protein